MSLERISCPSCGASRFDHDMKGNLICAHCGANFGAPQDHISCPSCHTQNPLQARKCMNCGLSLGKVCPSCNYSNPPGADHCLECATPLDTLTSVFMRTAHGQRKSTRTLRRELVRAKTEDHVYMSEQRAVLDAEEEERIRRLRNRQSEAIRQQRALMAVTLVIGGALVCGLLAFLLWMQ